MTSKKLRMINVLLVVFLFLWLVVVENADAEMTREEAIGYLMREVINLSSNKDKIMAFGPQDMLVSGNILEPYYLDFKPYIGQKKIINNNTWFFLINDNIHYKWTHATRFVYIDANRNNPTIGNGIVIEIQGWWPKINGVEYYKNPPKDDPDKVYGDIPASDQNKI